MKKETIKKAIRKMCLAAFHSDKPWTEEHDKNRNALLKKLAKLKEGEL